MVLLSDKVMAQAELASSNPLHDALSSAPIALAMFVALLTFSEFMTTQLCAHPQNSGIECTKFAAYISFFAYALLVAYVTVLVDAGMYYRRQQNQQHQSSHQAHHAHDEQQQENALEPAQ